MDKFDKFVGWWTGLKRSFQIFCVAVAIIFVIWLWGIVF